MKDVSLLQLYTVFAKVGTFTIGGGLAMVPLIEREMVARGWMCEDDFDDLLVLAQSAPGILAVNIAIYTGYHLLGLKGSIVAALGAVMPSFVIILGLALLFTQISGNHTFQSIFSGIRPAAIGLILSTGVRLAWRKCRSWWQWTLLAGSILLVAFIGISPISIIFITLILSLAIFIVGEVRKR